MMTKLRLLGLYILVLTAVSLMAVSCNNTAEPTPTATATIEVAAVTAGATDTAVLQPTDTEIPATATDAPEPATVTAPPTTASDEEAEATNTLEETVTADTEATATPTTAATETETEDEEQSADPTATSTLAPPANPSGVLPPPDNNYPDNNDVAGWENRINVPAGFEVSYVGRINGRPTSITFGPDGLLYVAAHEGDYAGMSGSIYTMDDNGNVNVYATGLAIPTGIAFRPGTSDLYVSSRVNNASVGGEAQVSIANGRQIIGGLPCCYTFFHSANGIAFGPDGMGYVGVGARADHGEILDGSNRPDELHPYEASILRFNPATGDVTVYARGFRNPYDIAWDANGQLWATDNTPDYDPPERLHRVVPGGLHGYPYYDCDVCFSPPPDVTVIPPLVTFTPSSAPTGITVYLANQFPGYYNSIFVTLWSAFPGAQKVMHIGPGGSAPSNFATGFAAPIDVTVSPDGSMYVADWATGIIFKITYTG